MVIYRGRGTGKVFTKIQRKISFDRRNANMDLQLVYVAVATLSCKGREENR